MKGKMTTTVWGWKRFRQYMELGIYNCDHKQLTWNFKINYPSSQIMIYLIEGKGILVPSHKGV
jgi:hypothetical protein